MHLGPAVRRARLGQVTWRAEAEVRTPACFYLPQAPGETQPRPAAPPLMRAGLLYVEAAALN